MTVNSQHTADLLARSGQGDEAALRELFDEYRERLKRMIHFRMSRRLKTRMDDSDILQEAYLEVAKKLPEYTQNPESPFFLWLRKMTGLKLAEHHRRHLGTQMRDADREVSIERRALPEADSMSLAVHLLGQLTSPSQAAIKAELRIKLQDALNDMGPIDREVIVLRHFEQLSGDEIAEELGLSKTGASSRYVRAISRLRKILSQFSEFFETF